MAIRVFVVEDDASLRQAFERMVGEHPRLSLTGSAASIAEARQQLPQAMPDVAIIDLGLPDGDGADLIEALQRIAPDTVVLVSTVFGDESHVIRAIEAGARGYLLKDTTLDEFARSILTVYEGGSPLSPQVARHLLKRFTPAGKARDKKERSSLTSRETDILTHISQGFSAVETAGMMAISPHTVTSHIKSIYSKLAVHNRIAAVNAARSKGIIH